MTTGDPPSFAELLRRLRTAATLTQEELSARAGLSVRAISDLERGVHLTPRLETVRLLGNALRLEAVERAALIAAAHPEDTASPLTRDPGASLYPELPETWTRLIGREAEIASLRRLLAEPEVRLLTLTGPGGVGKTRLAIQVAADHAADRGQPVAWVPLGAVRDPALVAPTVAHTLGVREASRRSPLQGLAAALRDRPLLLILDNFEQVWAAAPFVAELLAACHGLNVLVTSRAILRISGEQHYSVPPLTLPDPTDPPARLAVSEAVRLFVARAQEANPDFLLTPENAAPVATICRRLDGLPLAIELAAARLRQLTPSTLLARLERRQLALTGGPRDAPARQQTLQATIAWSYELLNPAEQRLLRHMAVFTGGCTFEAAAAVDRATGDLDSSSASAGAGQTTEIDTLGDIASLIDQSLLQRAAPVNTGPETVEPRFVMLETIREFGLKELEARGEAANTRVRHATWYTALAEEAEPALFGAPAFRRWMARLSAEHDNLRAALAWLIEEQNAEMSQQLAGALPRFWFMRGHISEGRSWLERSLALGDGTRPAIRARALAGLGILASFHLDHQQATRALDEAIAVAEAASDALGVAFARFGHGLVALQQGDFDSAMAHGAASFVEFEALGEAGRAGMSELVMGRAAHYGGDLAVAEAHYERFLTRSLLLDHEYFIAHAQHNLALLAQSRVDHELALSRFAEALALYRLCAEPWSVATCLSGAAVAIGVRGQAEQAAQLFGAAEELRDRTGAPMFPADRNVMEPVMTAIRTTMGHAAFVQAMATGAEWSMDTAIDMALAISNSIDVDPSVSLSEPLAD